MSRKISVLNVESSFVDGALHSAKIHTRSFEGLHRRLRLMGSGFLMILYFGTAWVTWDGHQAILWQLSKNKFHIFSQTFWPQDLIILTGILVVCAVGLFLLTMVAGRVWCGYTCPQSVWTWLFMWTEKITEGERHQRIRLDQSPTTIGKLLRRTQKNGLWLIISFITGLTFVGYFTPIRELAVDIVALETGTTTTFWLGFFTLATYINAGWLREKVCLHMCPYGRFQSSMLDADTLVVAYDKARGEPRGSRKRGATDVTMQLGDCIDCQLCVQVCPTGIDIRDGLQMACIGCAACIDVCNDVMDKMGYTNGLIRYASENELQGKTTRFYRPRVLGYAAVLLCLTAIMVWGISTRPLLNVTVAKDRMLYRYGSNGDIENIYLLKLANKDHMAHPFSISVSGPEGVTLSEVPSIVIGAGEMSEFTVVVSMPDVSNSEKVADILFAVEGPTASLSALVPSRFSLPR